MQRRKFIIGLSALSGGGAAALGTGAFQTMQSGERTVDVRVASDSDAYVGLAATSEYAAENEDGKLELFFGEEQGIFHGDGGVNPGSTYTFSNVFEVQAQHSLGDTHFYIEPSGFDVDIELTADEDHQFGDSRPNDPGQTLTDDDDPYKLVQPDSVGVDITIEATDEALEDAGGDIIIHAATGGNQDQLGN